MVCPFWWKGNESFIECCIREVEEETGYIGEVLEGIKVKRSVIDTFEVEIYYYLVKIVGGNMKIQDPDQLIYDVAWKSVEELNDLEFSFPEDKAYLQFCEVQSFLAAHQDQYGAVFLVFNFLYISNSHTSLCIQLRLLPRDFCLYYDGSAKKSADKLIVFKLWRRALSYREGSFFRLFFRHTEADE